ncbi:MAG: hypothetical protein WBV93_10255 [Anaerobacillus sp.]
MFNVSLVCLTDINDLNQAAQLLEHNSVLDEPVEDEDWPDHEVLTKRWNVINNRGMNIQNLQAGTREEIRFIFIQGYNERTKRKDKWFEDPQLRNSLVQKSDRVNITEVKSIFFEYEEKVYFAPWLPPSSSLNTFTNDLLPRDIWGETIRHPQTYQIQNDFFYWILNAFTRGNRIVNRAPHTAIRSWTGFHGTTQDSTHNLSGDGERISAILGTLAFLFMNDPLKALSVSIDYENERLPLVLGAKGNLQISEYEYEGRFSNAYLDDNRKILLTILAYTKIIPSLFQGYEIARNQNTWNTNSIEEFTQWIGDEILTRVNTALQI